MYWNTGPQIIYLKRSTESGQAVLFAVALIPIVLFTGLFIFNTGQLTAIKLKTQNAADSAAFSAMQMEARELNFIAYTNRAMLANQLAIGQTISLVSWGHYVKNLGRNIQYFGEVAALIPSVGSIITTLTSAIGKASEVLEKSVETASRIILPALDVADAALSGAQEAYHFSNGVFDPGKGNNKPGGAMTAVAGQIVKLNDPDARLNAVILATNLADYFKKRSELIQRWGGSKEDAQARMASMINASRDLFTTARNELPPPLELVKYMLSSSSYITGWDIPRRGGSQIAEDPQTGNYAWSAMDTLSLHIRQGKLDALGEWTNLSEIPLGWGASQTGGGSHYMYLENYSEKRANPKNNYPPDEKTVSLPAYQDSWRHNPVASRIAASEYPGEQDTVGTSTKQVGGDANRFSAGGISRYWDFNRLAPKLKSAKGDPSDLMPFYIIVVEHSRGSMRDAAKALHIKQSPSNPNINFVLPLKAQGDHVRSVAKAQAFFRRPDSLWRRNDNYREKANLFSPFWEARLVDLNATDRMQCAALLGIH